MIDTAKGMIKLWSWANGGFTMTLCKSFAPSLCKLWRYEDRDELPYVEAVILEILRWSSGVPVLPHGTSSGGKTPVRIGEFCFLSCMNCNQNSESDNLWSSELKILNSFVRQVRNSGWRPRVPEHLRRAQRQERLAGLGRPLRLWPAPLLGPWPERRRQAWQASQLRFGQVITHWTFTAHSDGSVTSEI